MSEELVNEPPAKKQKVRELAQADAVVASNLVVSRTEAIRSGYAKFAKDLKEYGRRDSSTGCLVPMNHKKGGQFGCFAWKTYLREVQFRCASGKTEVKPLAHRMVFATNAAMAALVADDTVHVSHLCHNDICCEKTHLVLGENLDYNKSRNVCPGHHKCIHFPRCLQPGRQFQIVSPMVYTIDEHGTVVPFQVLHKGSECDELYNSDADK